MYVCMYINIYIYRLHCVFLKLFDCRHYLPLIEFAIPIYVYVHCYIVHYQYGFPVPPVAHREAALHTFPSIYNYRLLNPPVPRGPRSSCKKPIGPTLLSHEPLGGVVGVVGAV